MDALMLFLNIMFIILAAVMTVLAVLCLLISRALDIFSRQAGSPRRRRDKRWIH